MDAHLRRAACRPSRPRPSSSRPQAHSQERRPWQRGGLRRRSPVDLALGPACMALSSWSMGWLDSEKIQISATLTVASLTLLQRLSTCPPSAGCCSTCRAQLCRPCWPKPGARAGVLWAFLSAVTGGAAVSQASTRGRGCTGQKDKRTRGQWPGRKAACHQAGWSVPGSAPEHRRPLRRSGVAAGSVKPQGPVRASGLNARGQVLGGPGRTGPCATRSSGATERTPPGFGPMGRGSPGAALITRESSRPLSGQQSPPAPTWHRPVPPTRIPGAQAGHWTGLVMTSHEQMPPRFRSCVWGHLIKSSLMLEF